MQIFWKFIHYILHEDKTYVKKFSSDKIKLQKMHSVFFRESNSVLLLIRDSYTSWGTRFISLKVCMVFSIFKSLCFCSTKNMDSLTLKRHNSRKNKNNRKAAHSFASRSLTFKLQEKVWKLNNICVNWSFKINFLKVHKCWSENPQISRFSYKNNMPKVSRYRGYYGIEKKCRMDNR